MASNVGGGEAAVPTGTKRKRGGRKAAEPPAAVPAPVKTENGDGPTPRKRGKSSSAAAAAAAAAAVAAVPEPVKVEEVVTTDAPVNLGDLENEVRLEAKVKGDSESPKVKADTDIKNCVHWQKPDIEQLLERLTSLLPGEDNVRYNTQADRVDWEKIRFGNYTAVDCKRQWNLIITKLRRFRTMTELLVDAKNWAKQPWTSFNKKQSKHPDMPKKPLTPYFRYFMEKRAKYSQQHPDLSMTEISMVLAQRYRALADKKKQKYIDAYNKENDEYKVLLAKFKEDHPDLYDDMEAEKAERKGASTSTGTSKGLASMMLPPKATTPMQLYIEAKTEEHRKKDPTLSKKEYYDMYKMKWAEMADSKKLKYINKAVEVKAKYDESMQIYMSEHPDYKPRHIKSFLNKYEQKVKDKHEGKPDKPPPNGYGLFTSQVLSKLTDIPSNERMAEVSRRWKALKEEDREKFNKNAVQKMSEYRQAMQVYLKKLPEAEREKLATDSKTQLKSKTDKASSSAPQERPKQPVSALFLFVNEKRDKYRNKYPDMDHQELTRLIAKEFTALPPEKKAKYKKMEEEHKQQISHTPSETPMTPSRARNTQFPGEPRKPPGSGYQLFSTEMLVKLKDIHSQQRMAVISEKWKAMSEAQRNAYKAKREKLWAKYYSDLKKFRAGLSKADAVKYEELEQQRKAKRTTPAATKAAEIKAAAAAKEEESEEDSSDDDDDDDDDESGDDSDAEESDADSDSASESEEESDAEPPKPALNGPSKDGATESDSESESEAESGTDTSSEVSGSSETASESASASESESESD